MLTKNAPAGAGTRRFWAVSDLLVLCYHAVSDSWPAALAAAPEQLEEHVKRLLERGYVGTTFTEALRGRTDGRALAVTFDDAYRSVIELGFPLLSRLGVPATVFAPTSFIGSDRPMSWPGIDEWLGGPHEPELTPMGWDELESLRAAGWEIGSHSSSHPRLTRLGDAELAEELDSSRETLQERLGAPCTSIAYPYGDVDRRVARAARDSGYEAGGGLAAYEFGSDTLHWPRVGVYRRDSAQRFRLKVSRLARRASLARLRHAFEQA
jgi:peptidoglycan/xylan/chitin deacetylase (PgdA/CDA1 family)